MYKVLLFLFAGMFCSDLFAIQCTDDEKFVPVQANQIGFNMYTKHVPHDVISDIYGEWRIVNHDNQNFYVHGKSACISSEIYDVKTNKTGPHCFCRIDELDGYKISADWVDAKIYQTHMFDENRTYTSENAKKFAKDMVNRDNTTECKQHCSEYCQTSLTRQSQKIRGYYVCDKSLLKKLNVLCTIKDKYIKTQVLSVFEDVAEINTGDDSIIFMRDKSNVKDMMYVGEFEYDTAYLKVSNGKVYTGYKTYSMEECF